MKYNEQTLPLTIVDGLELPTEYRAILRPDEPVNDVSGVTYRLPRFFYRVESLDVERNTKLAEHFYIFEFLKTDFREVELLSQYPKYLPITVCYTAAILELFRHSIGKVINVASNGGYRSPFHKSNTYMSTHCWGTAVNIYKIGNDILDNKEMIKKYADIFKKTVPGAWVRPYGTELGTCYDQLHIDLGYTTVNPTIIPELKQLQ